MDPQGPADQRAVPAVPPVLVPPGETPDRLAQEVSSTPCPHMSFVIGDDHRFLRTRYDALKAHALFRSMEYSEDHDADLQVGAAGD